MDVATAETKLESKILSDTQNSMNSFGFKCHARNAKMISVLKLKLHLIPGQFLILKKQLKLIQ